jgi:hypothetical protein
MSTRTTSSQPGSPKTKLPEAYAAATTSKPVPIGKVSRTPAAGPERCLERCECAALPVRPVFHLRIHVGDRQEFFGVKARATHQRAIHVGD